MKNRKFFAFMLLLVLGACSEEPELTNPVEVSHQVGKEEMKHYFTSADNDGTKENRSLAGQRIEGNELPYYNDIDLTQTYLTFKHRGVVRDVAMFNLEVIQ